MPIISIISQPSINDLKAAYRPVILRVSATRTDGNATPPVVYCDIYVNGIFYKSTEKTQYSKLNTTNSEWQFDISDPVQEVLKAFLPPNGGSTILPASPVMALIYCKFRSSGYSSEGFMVPEGTVPVQATGTNPAVPGTGTQSNSFYVPNSVLQHEQNQNLAAHLNYYKTGNWAGNVYPLSHRRDGYKVCKGDNDYFPLISLSDKDISCVKINYKLKGSNTLYSQSTCSEPVACAGIISLNGNTALTPVACADITSLNGSAESTPVSCADISSLNGTTQKTMSGSVSFNNHSTSPGDTIDSVSPLSTWTNILGQFPVQINKSASGQHSDFTGTITISCNVANDARIEVYKNGVFDSCDGQIGTGAQDYVITLNVLATDNIEINLEEGNVCP